MAAVDTKIVKLIPPREIEKDPHVWLSPKMLLAMAETITRTIKNDIPASAAVLDKCSKNFAVKVENTAEQLSLAFKKCPQKKFFALHGAFGRLADGLGLVQDALEKEGKHPSALQTATWLKKIKTRKTRFVLTTAQADDNMCRKITSMTGAEIIKIDTMSPEPLETMKKTAEILLRYMCRQNGKKK